MAENRDIIRERMLSNLSNKYDRLPGSWTWETYQAEAIEMESLQILLDNGLDQAFAGTADLEHLKVMAFEDRGIVYKEATFASGEVTITGIQGAIITEGDLFANELLQYKALETKTIDSTLTTNVKIECTTAGSVGNTVANSIIYFPVSIQGLDTVTNTQEISNGYDEEGRDSLLQRYYNEIRKPATSGNINHYINWALSVEGVGNVKVKPLWNGNGTVKVVILDSNKQPADQSLITKTSNYIETQRPIGASVTVSTATELDINVNCEIQVTKDYTLDQAKANIQTNIQNYFKENAFEDQTIYYAKIGNIIFNSEGVNNLIYNTFTINNAKNDIILIDSNTETQIAKLGTLTVTSV